MLLNMYCSRQAAYVVYLYAIDDLFTHHRLGIGYWLLLLYVANYTYS